MGQTTSRANLYLPGGGSTGTNLPDETADIDKLNDNFKKIDALLGARNVASAASYSGTMDGDLVYTRDKNELRVYDATLGQLVLPTLPGAHAYRGTGAERGAFKVTAIEGDIWQDTDTDKITFTKKGATWVPKMLSGTNVTIKSSAASSTPYSLTVTFSIPFIAPPAVVVCPYSNTVVGSPVVLVRSISATNFVVDSAHNLGTRDIAMNWVAFEK
jgi:hypothetical protein